MAPALRTFLRTGCVLAVVVIALFGVSGCTGDLLRFYEYEEEVYIDVDGGAVVNVNASVASLVNLRGVELDTNPTAQIDRDVLRRAYTSPVTRVSKVGVWRRAGRRFVQVRVEVDDIAKLSQSPMFAWSTYGFASSGGELIFKQHLGAAQVKGVGNVGWDGGEVVAVRVHVPSRILYHNAGAANLKRGNILVWEQTLADRQAGKPLEIEVRMARTSILYSTLKLFAVSGALALLVMAAIVYWVVTRAKGRNRPGA